MGLKVAIIKETTPHENRVAASADTVKKLTKLGCAVSIESGAGLASSITDDAFKSAGAKIVETAENALKTADIILKVRAPSKDELKHIKKNTLIIALFKPHDNAELIEKCAKSNLQTFSMELVPRITRAQSIDVLSSQSNLSGYKAVLDACEAYNKALPMMMTAAGTAPPAKVFIMGAGVAGLQAIATARRLGAIVSATDVRPAAKEQVESLGATFVAVEDDEFKQAETSGGYAKQMSKTYQKKQADLVEEHIKKQDIVITTALIPGRVAPKLITEAMIKSMSPGAVIVDLAVESGGNVALSKPGDIVEKYNVKIIGHKNVPSRIAASASALYAKNLLNLLNLIIDKDSGALNVDWDDEIIKNIALTKDGKVIHPNFKSKKPAAKTTTKAQKVENKKPAAKAAKKAPAKKKTQNTTKNIEADNG